MEPLITGVMGLFVPKAIKQRLYLWALSAAFWQSALLFYFSCYFGSVENKATGKDGL
jgi:hypothetical protein